MVGVLGSMVATKVPSPHAVEPFVWSWGEGQGEGTMGCT